jgi:hypothetical protein
MLNKETVLKLTDSGMAVFRHYIPCQWRVGRNFLNPLYDDKKASCNVYFDRRNGCYRLKDFGNDDYSGDCFSFIGKLKGLDCGNSRDFVEILKTINRDLSLGLHENDTSFIVSVVPKPVHGCEPLKQAEPPKKQGPIQLSSRFFPQRKRCFGNNTVLLPLY